MKIKGKILNEADIDNNSLDLAIQIKTDNNEYMIFYAKYQKKLYDTVYSKLKHDTYVEITYHESSCKVKIAENHPEIELDYYQIDYIEILDN